MNYILILSILVNIAFTAVNFNIDLIQTIHVEAQNSNGNYGVSDVWGYTDETGIEYAIVGYRYGTFIYDVSSDPQLPQLISDIPGPSGNDMYYHRDYKTHGDILYIVNEMTGDDVGMQIVDLSPLPENEPIKLDTYTGVSQSHNLWIDEDRELAFVENSYPHNVKTLDISNPENPIQVGTFSGEDGIDCHDIYSRGDFAYVSEGWSEKYGIYDISDITDPIRLATISVIGYAHNAWLNDAGTHLITTEETELMPVKIWDIQDLGNINLVSDYLGENNLAHNVHVMDDQLIISHYTTGVKIVDIFDPENPVEVAAYDTYPANDYTGYYGCWGAYPYTQNGMLYASDMQNGLFIFDYTPKYASWRIGHLHNMDGEVLPNVELKSVLNEKSFFTDMVGRFNIGFPDGEYEFEIIQDDILLDTITITFTAHESVNEAIYLGIDNIILGDVNGDSIINVLDIVNIVNFILSYSEPDFQASIAADVNGDGVINVLDIIAIVNLIIEQ
ncbi:MAG: choice-of-anchor B family protein [Candidatus Marinimicrobia bacterium]|nr:choice-of-anchor B family protein [Candidatus Neomarinimicrobiota bacterium]